MGTTDIKAEMVEAVKTAGVGGKDAKAFVTGALSDDGPPADLTKKVSVALAENMNATARLNEEVAKNASALNEEVAKNASALDEKTKASIAELSKNTTAVTKCHSGLVKCNADCGKALGATKAARK